MFDFRPADWPFGDLLQGDAAVIEADPPWDFENRSEKGEGRNPNQHYETMTIAEIAALPVWELAAPDCALFLWAVKPRLRDAFTVLDGWGFTYKTIALTWVKTRPSGKEFMGAGYWTRGNPELCLLATRGAPERRSRAVRELLEAPGADWSEGIIRAHAREHSRKPDEVYERIAALVDGPRVSLFSRTRREGWACWGREVGKFDAALAEGAVE